MSFYKHKKRFYTLIGLFSALCFSISSLKVQAETTEEENERRIAIPIESNQIPNWPEGPVTHAQSAILMDVNTHAILYGKNIHEHLYPASITKILTCLLAVENCTNLEEIVEVSSEAVYTVPFDGTNVGLDAGESLTLEDALYAILLKSANEASNAVGEHVSGSISAFVDLMNERAKELGCQDSHFVTTNGLHDEDHYTSTYDMALIGSSFFSNELLCKISGTKYHQIPATDTQPDLIDMYSRNELLPGRGYAYEYLVGSKTGYTSLADNTLVTCAEKDGMKLVCVVMGDNLPYHYEDTIALFEYGFANFSSMNIAEYESRYTINTSDFFQSDFDVFGNSKQFISLDPTDYLILPKSLHFEDLDCSLSYETSSDSEIATIYYSYQSHFLGSCDVLLNKDTDQEIIFDTLPESSASSDTGSQKDSNKLIFINIVPILIGIFIFVFIVIISFVLKGVFRNYHFGPSFREKLAMKRRHRTSRSHRSVNRYQRKQQARNRKRNKSRNTHRRRKLFSFGFMHFDTSINMNKHTRKRLKSPRKKRRKHKSINTSIHFSSKDFPK